MSLPTNFIQIQPNDLLVMWTTALIFVMWRTKSLTSNWMLTSLVGSLAVIAVLHRIYGEVGCLYLMMVVITVFVWIEIPKYNHARRKDDKWT